MAIPKSFITPSTYRDLDDPTSPKYWDTTKGWVSQKYVVTILGRNMRPIYREIPAKHPLPPTILVGAQAMHIPPNCSTTLGDELTYREIYAQHFYGLVYLVHPTPH